ncbi:MAG: AarF/ABC1/UbiB kinase family protein [Pseudomonadota bacterium]|nr:AarF/ABC1/UbiB kinase family protein [Pseudomonadota bacterium]
MNDESRSGSPGRRGRTLLGLGLRTAARSAWVGARGLLPGEVDSSAALRALGADWVQTLGQLKGAAMKLGQFASLLRGALPDAVVDQLEALQQQAHPLPFDEIAPLIEAQCGALDRQFASIEPQALAAASMGQVHRARLRDGRAVVIKVRYPGVRNAIDEDLRQLARIIKSARVLRIDAASLDASLAEIRARLHEEADYRIERQHLARFATDTRVPGIHLPEAVDALCGESVLVLTEHPALRLSEACAAPLPQRQQWSVTLTRWLLHQLLTTGLIHADPNPGNFGFLPDGHVVLYDFGCVKTLTPTLVDQLRQALRHGMAQDWPAVHAALVGLGTLTAAGAERLDALTPLYQATHEAALGRLLAAPQYDFAQDQIHEQMRALAPLHLRHIRDFRSAPELLFAGRTLSGYYWMLRQLAASLPLPALLDEALATPVRPVDSTPAA